MGNYPPSHRNTDDPQPEVCDLCGLTIGGAHLFISDAEGLEGAAVCDAHQSCRMRHRMMPRLEDASPVQSLGGSRIFPPGAKANWNDD